VWRRDLRKDHPETATPGDPSHIQPPNPDTIVNANKRNIRNPMYSWELNNSLLNDNLVREEIRKKLKTF